MSNNLTPNRAQLKAIRYAIDKPLKVVAGAGAGKTAVLTYRFMHLVEKHQIAPQRILALTFTKKAAAEMQDRITAELLRKKLIDRAEAPLLLWIGNFHSVCHRLVRQSALLVGVDPSFAVIDEAEQRLIVDEVVDDFLNKRLSESPSSDAFDALMIERVGEFAQNMVTVLNRIKNHFPAARSGRDTIASRLNDHYDIVGQGLNETISNETIHGNTREAAQKRLESLPGAYAHERLMLDALWTIFQEYEQRLEAHDLLDFNDLILTTCRLVEIDPSLKNHFSYILVDEFQDTDRGQYRLLEILSDNFRNVTVVCDKKQSIYEWREARIENIDDFPGESIFLDENYRSVGEILDAANCFISHSMPEEQPLKPAETGGRGRADSTRVKLFRAPSREIEALHIAGEICDLIEAGTCNPGDISILMRSINAAGEYEKALRTCGIPYTTVGSRGFYELEEAKDLLALLRILSNPFDDLSMTRIMQSAIVGLSDASLSALCSARKHPESSIYDVLKNKEALADDFRPLVRERLQNFLRTLDELSNLRWWLSIGELISEVLDRTDYLKYLVSIEGPRGPRFSNVARFYKTAAFFEERHLGAGLEEFLSYLDTSTGAETGTSADDPGSGVVQIMTVHQAKGLEFPVVFIVNLGPTSFPLQFRADGFGYDEKAGLFVRKIPHEKYSVRYEGGYGVNIEEQLRERHQMEENRIMYVAMTRAKNHLYLTTSTSDKKNGKDFFQNIENVATEIGAECGEVLDTATILAHMPERGDRTAEGMTIEDIKSGARKALDRISRGACVEPVSQVSGTITMSYSRLAMFRHCPMKYALSHVYSLPLSPHEESLEEAHQHADAFALGNLLHRTLMLYHRGRRTGRNMDILKIFKDIAGSVSRETMSAGKKMIEDYLNSPLSRVDTLYEEKEFHWLIKDGSYKIFFEGKVDRIDRDGTSLKIIDYKTGAHKSTSHTFQLAIYRLAMESILSEQDIRTSNFYLSKGEEVECRFSRGELGNILSGIAEDARKIADGEFEVEADGKHKDRNCANCGYEPFCPRRREELST